MVLLCKLVLPGKHVCRCSVSVSWVTDLWAEFIAEIASSNTSPNGMNCDWLMGDILMGGTSPAKRQKSLLFMLDKTVLKHISLEGNRKNHGALNVPKSSMATIILKWNLRVFSGMALWPNWAMERSVIWDLWQRGQMEDKWEKKTVVCKKRILKNSMTLRNKSF